MRKRAPNLEWQIVEREADWERLHTPPPDITPATSRRLRLQRYLWGGAALLLLVVGVGEWWWRTAQAGLHTPAAAGTATAQPAVLGVAQRPDRVVPRAVDHLSDADWWLQHEQGVSDLRRAVQTVKPTTHLDVPLHAIKVQGNQAVTLLVMYTDQGAPAYRQARFYWCTTSEWRQTAPDATLWGPERSLETPSFVYHFRQNDAAAVIAVAPQIDALYTTLLGNLGLPLSPGAEKLIIEVTVAQSPGTAAFLQRTEDRFVVPSPAVYLAPVELTDAELLAQSLALPLLEQVLAQASEQYAVGKSWRPLLDGLRLWQLWEMDLPLATWREEVVRWMYYKPSIAGSEQAVVLPDRYEELCAAYTLWMPSPTWMDIPLVCTDLDQDEWFFASWGPRDSLTRLEQFSVPAPEALVGPPFPVHHPGQTVALATLTEYAVATYGRERLPALVAGLGQYESWETLIPAVYGVSSAEFEVGWQTYLATHFGVSPIRR